MLKDIQSSAQLKALSVRELEALAEELRHELVRVVSENGGHLASNLGIVELTLALDYVFDCPDDKLVFDVGHQSYVHKLLTGRYARFSTLRKQGGLSGFPDPKESESDCFVAGHASSAISAALGMARTRDIMHADNCVVAVVGDGALTGGMCYEALNDAGQSNTRMIVILNDNEMSISKNVGALSHYLTGLRQSKGYRGFKRNLRSLLERIPNIGMPIFHFLEKMRDMLKSLVIDGKFFDALGFEYMGPIDGHNLKRLIRVLRRAKDTDHPLLIHVVTQKGRGYAPAEDRPDAFHGVAPFYLESGRVRGACDDISCGAIIAHQLSELADGDIRISVVCAAMAGGTGMTEFQKAHPDRFFDVGIAEEHAVTMAAGMASSGMKPYVAIYSTFMQRAYDQIMIDVCRCGLPVTLLLDHAGFVGADGKTHQGLYDISWLRSIPGLIVAAPRDVRDLKKLISMSAKLNAPMAIRYPKGGVDLGPGLETRKSFLPGEWELLSDGADVMIYACGPDVQVAMQCAVQLMGRGIHAGVTDARFLKPMDARLVRELSARVKLTVTMEENTRIGGLAEGVARILAEAGIACPLLALGAPDEYVAHATIDQQRAAAGLDVAGICARIEAALQSKGEVQ